MNLENDFPPLSWQPLSDPPNISPETHKYEYSLIETPYQSLYNYDTGVYDTVNLVEMLDTELLPYVHPIANSSARYIFRARLRMGWTKEEAWVDAMNRVATTFHETRSANIVPYPD